MAKARGNVQRSNKPKPGFVRIVEPTIHIGEWSPRTDGKNPTQVHLSFHIPGLDEYPMVLRYKSPDTLGFIIEELARYRNLVWPDAEPLDLSGKMPEEADHD